MAWVAAGVIVAAVGVAISAAAAVNQAQQAERTASFNKKVAENAALAARQAAEANAASRKEVLRRVLAQQRANLGGSGVADTTGSPLLVQIDSARQAELERLRVLHGGEQRALAFETQANVAQWGGRQAAAAAYTQAGTSLLSGVSQGLITYGQSRQRAPSPPPA